MTYETYTLVEWNMPLQRMYIDHELILLSLSCGLERVGCDMVKGVCVGGASVCGLECVGCGMAKDVYVDYLLYQ